MGREQRSRRKLPHGALCYLCGQPITDGEKWNRDHVPPERIFGKRVRREHSVDLQWLYTHQSCNSAYKDDEEYFVVSLVGHHHTPTAKAVWEDIKRGAANGHGRGLIKAIIGQFGKVTTADGSMVFQLDADRAHRAVWKIVRGLYTLETSRFLPDNTLRSNKFVPQSEAEKRLTEHPWFWNVRDTESIGKHPGVFDYKWLCWPDGEARINMLAMLLWDNLILLCLFHDPACRCEKCLAKVPGAAASASMVNHAG